MFPPYSVQRWTRGCTMPSQVQAINDRSLASGSCSAMLGHNAQRYTFPNRSDGSQGSPAKTSSFFKEKFHGTRPVNLAERHRVLRFPPSFDPYPTVRPILGNFLTFRHCFTIYRCNRESSRWTATGSRRGKVCCRP